MFKKLANLLGIKSYIKIPHRSFSQLDDVECAKMIDAFLNNGNEFFEQNALPEFTLMSYKSERLESLKRRVNDIQEKHRTKSEPDGLMSDAGKEELIVLEDELGRKGSESV